MPELGICNCCGEYRAVHGNENSKKVFCDDCCLCYNHCSGGKYYNKSMDELLLKERRKKWSKLRYKGKYIERGKRKP